MNIAPGKNKGLLGKVLLEAMKQFTDGVGVQLGNRRNQLDKIRQHLFLDIASRLKIVINLIMNTYNFEDADNGVNVPALVGRKLIGGGTDFGGHGEFEFGISDFQERQQLANHDADVGIVD
jgi:hypothetical protein